MVDGAVRPSGPEDVLGWRCPPGGVCEALAVLAHTDPVVPLVQAKRIVEHLVRGPRSLLVLQPDGQPRALAAVIDTCDSVDDTAMLELISLSRGPLGSAALRQLIQRAEAIARSGPRRGLDVALPPGSGPWAAAEALGYAVAYGLFELQRDAHLPLAPARTALPPGLRWQALSPPLYADYHRVVAAAFADVPGALVPSLGELVRAVQASGRPPRILADGGGVAGFVRVGITDGVGQIHSVGRDPRLRGLGLGDHLVREGLSELIGSAGRVVLEVAARNTQAVHLYQRHGFEQLHQTDVLRRAWS